MKGLVAALAMVSPSALAATTGEGLDLTQSWIGYASLAIFCGCLQLSDDGRKAPPEKIEACIISCGVDLVTDRICVFTVGQYGTRTGSART